MDTLMEKLRVEGRIETLEKLDTSRVLVQLSCSVLIFEDRARILREERNRRVQVEKKLFHIEKLDKDSSVCGPNCA